LVAWQFDLAKHWSSLRFGSATVQRTGEQYSFDVQVFLKEMNPDAVGVELYADGANGAGATIEKMTRGGRLAGTVAGFMYSASVTTTRPAADFTPRIVPQHDDALVPLEAHFILWHDAPSWR
jgi:starch phosphorylase